MKTDKEILDEFGKKLINDVFEFNYFMLSSNLKKNLESGDLHNKIDTITRKSLESIMFAFLKIFEEQENYKLIYEENGKQVNLEEISEMLKAEPIIENGWIDRFSKYSDKK